MSDWRRYWRFVGWMSALGVVAGLLALLWLRWIDAQMPGLARLAVGLGVMLTMATAGALMGLVFLSSRSGHDRAADSRDEE